MLSHKIGLMVACLLVSSLAMADSFKVEWSLTENGTTTKLDQFSHSFKAHGMNCEVSRSAKMLSSQDGTGLMEVRSLTCKQGKTETVKQEIRCDRKQVSSFIEYGEIYLSCNVK